MGYVLDDAVIEKINHISPGANQTLLGNLVDQALGGILPPGSVALSELEMATAGKVIASNGAAVANTWKTISASAPAFTGSALGTHIHAAITAGTPAGSVAAPVFTGAAMGTHQHDAISAGTPAGSVAAPTFTGSALGTHIHDAITAGTPSGTITGKLELATPAFSGTGWATVGQVVTTTDNQTMPAVDTAAGMWLVFDSSPASPPVLIMSNTIVAGSPAVLTCQGVPAATGAGTYKIFTMGAATFVGNAMATHQHNAITAGTPAGTNDAPAFTGSAMATHQHAAITAGTPAGTNDAPAFTGSALGTHQHAAVTAGTPAGSVAAPAITLA